MGSGLSWADYLEGHPERLPKGEGETWADVPAAEHRRVTRNWRRWQERRRWPTGEPMRFVLKGDAVVVEKPKRKTYSEAETQAQRQAVLAAVESGKSFAVAAADAGVPVGRARWLYREAVRLQHSTEQTSVSTDPLPEV